MGKYIHLFDTVNEFTEKYWQDTYIDPWVSYTEENQQVDYERDSTNFEYKVPLTFKILEDGEVIWKSGSDNYKKTIEVSKNYKEWISITSSTVGVTIPVKENDILRFKGSSAPGNATQYGSSYFTSTCRFKAYGNIDSLVHKTNYGSSTNVNYTTNYAFRQLFQTSKIVDAEDLIIPYTSIPESFFREMFKNCVYLTKSFALNFTTLNSSCYSGMFSGCTSLETAPNLPATTVPYNAYSNMFSGCTSLSAMPTISATILGGESVFSNMFNGCTGLTSVSVPNVNELTASCFKQMFTNCTGIQTMPQLTWTTLTQSCYESMFEGCTSLITLKTLPSLTLAANCYKNMFKGCTSLTASIALPATNTISYSYYGMFSDCTSLETISQISATYIAANSMQEMFKNCTSLTTSPNLSGSSVETSGFQAMFYDCSSLINAGSIAFTEIKNNGCNSMFSGCTSLITAPVLSTTSLTGSSSYGYMFSRCTSLTNAPVLPATTINAQVYKGMFKDCTSLITAPNLPATVLTGTECYYEMFMGCTALKNTPTLYPTTLTASCYMYMFNGCTSLESTPNLPATTLANYCYNYMFTGCTSLTQASSLSASVLAMGCYSHMFENCTSLTSAPTISAESVGSNSCEYMFSGCSALTTAPTLSATSIYTSSYASMFSKCTSLTTAPELPASILSRYSYESMFSECSNLQYVKCLATGYAAGQSNGTYNWLSNVYPKGVLEVADKSFWTRNSTYGLPSGWVFKGEIQIDNILRPIKLNGGVTHITGYSGTNFEIINNNNWITISNSNYGIGSVDISCTIASTSSERSGIIQIKNLADDSLTDITISQTSKDYVVDLNNGQWAVSSTSGPNGETVYMSDSSWNVNSGASRAYIHLLGGSSFTLKVKTYGQRYYDYLVVSELDKTPTKTSSTGGTTGNKWSGYSISSGTTWYDVIYNNLDGEEHVITLLYSKNASTNSGDDRGYFYIPE